MPPNTPRAIAAWAILALVSGAAHAAKDEPLVRDRARMPNHAPAFPAGPVGFRVLERSPIGTVVGVITATDADPEQTLEYSIPKQSTEGAFAVDAAGRVRVADGTKLDFFERDWHTIQVQVTDGRETATTRIDVKLDTTRTRVGVVASDPEASEVRSNSGRFLIVREGKIDQEMTIDLAVGGTATPGIGNDYATLPDRVTMAANQSTAEVRVTPYDDAIVDAGDETVFLSVLPNGAYSIAPEHRVAAVSIFDDETASLSVIATERRTTEGKPKAAQLKVWRHGPTESSLVVNFTTAGEGEKPATSADFRLSSGGVEIDRSVVIPAGKDTVVIEVLGTADGVVEGDEALKLTLTDGTAYRIDETVAEAVVTIDDADDQTVIIRAVGPKAIEEDPDTGCFAVLRQGNLKAPLTIAYKIAPSSTAAPSDYTGLKSGQISFAAGEHLVRLFVAPVDDGTGEQDETVTLVLQPGDGYWLLEGANQATVTIQDGRYDRTKENWVSLRASREWVTESGPTNTVTIQLSRTGPLEKELSVGCFVGGTATEAQDFTISGSFAFQSGSATTTVTVKAVDDSVWEDDQKITLQILPPLKGQYVVERGQAMAVITIKANDDPRSGGGNPKPVMRRRVPIGAYLPPKVPEPPSD